MAPEKVSLERARSGIARNVAEIRQRIGEACARSGRSETDVTLVAVSKYYPVEFVSVALKEGVSHFGENRPQELARKAAAVGREGDAARIHWHMIGHIQRNKAAVVADTAELVHSVDSVRLAAALSGRREDSPEPLHCLVQVNISSEASKGGFEPAEVLAGIGEMSALRGIRIVGLMGMAAPALDLEEIRVQFAGLRRLADELRSAAIPGVEMTQLSMGMSGDFEVAIEEGATLIRLGSAVFEQGR
jgi:hypothetical protein